MPNWCSNSLKVMGNKKAIKAFDKNFKGLPAKWPSFEDEVIKLKKDAKQEKIYCFNALRPVPEEILEIGYDIGSNPKYKSSELRKKKNRASNKKLAGRR